MSKKPTRTVRVPCHLRFAARFPTSTATGSDRKNDIAESERRDDAGPQSAHLPTIPFEASFQAVQTCCGPSSAGASGDRESEPTSRRDRLSCRSRLFLLALSAVWPLPLVNVLPGAIIVLIPIAYLLEDGLLLAVAAPRRRFCRWKTSDGRCRGRVEP
jgi:hypothetical protein